MKENGFISSRFKRHCRERVDCVHNTSYNHTPIYLRIQGMIVLNQNGLRPLNPSTFCFFREHQYPLMLRGYWNLFLSLFLFSRDQVGLRQAFQACTELPCNGAAQPTQHYKGSHVPGISLLNQLEVRWARRGEKEGISL